jgi:preprotein translocase subunit SecF|tara:strand:+ start:1882 stop:2814 length:933 start_codon:yes stop_codon:yes gene_type:complete
MKEFNLNLIKYYKKAIIGSAFLFIISISSIIFLNFNFGVDFKGGTVIELTSNDNIQIEEIRTKLEQFDDIKFSVQYFGSNKDIIIRYSNLKNQNESFISNKIINSVNENNEFSLNRIEFVGAQVGEELRDQGITAALIALFLVMVYITLRFEYRFSIGAIIALIHDIIILMGIFSLFQVEFNLSVFAAILAVIGYSLNDTIVVFDRIRENFQETINNDQSDIKEIINHSINQTLSRTVITSFTTLLVLFSLITLGGESLFGFSFALILGVIIGTYSSIYIASSYLIVSKISAKDMQIEKNDKDDNDGAVV